MFQDQNFMFQEVSKFYVLGSKFWGRNFVFLGSKFCNLGLKFCNLGSKFCILTTKLEILVKYKFRHYLGMQISSLPQNLNFVTTSKSKLPQNPNFVTASESKFGRIIKTENSIEIVKFPSKNSNSMQKKLNFVPKMKISIPKCKIQNFVFKRAKQKSQNIAFKDYFCKNSFLKSNVVKCI